MNALPQAQALADGELLRRYVDHRDQSAFAELVQRHVRLVYSAAVRRVGDRHLAQDVSQAVFLILAKKARTVRGGAPLSQWLLKTVRYAAANARRMETRRQQREQRAMAQTSAGSARAGWASADPSAVLLWQELATQLDDAVLALSAADRHVVLMRYFQERPLGDIAAQLHTSEGAIKQRLHRSLQKLRQQLQRRGALGEDIAIDRLAHLIEAHVMLPAPPGLALACAATAGGAASIHTLAISKGAMKMMGITKAKIAAAVVSVVLAGGVGGVIQLHRAAAADQSSALQQPAAPPAVAPAQVDPAVADAVGEAPPVVVSTEPRAGAVDVDPSITEIRVTYSKPMMDGGWSWCSNGGENTFPQTTGKPHYEADHRTCVLPVKLEPGKIYRIYPNRGQFMNFQDTDNRPALPYALVFGTRK